MNAGRGLLLPLFAVGAMACQVTDERFEVEADDLSALRVSTPEGHIDVVADDDVTTIGVDARRWGRHTRVDWDVRDGELRVDTVCGGAVCAVDYVITIPSAVWVDLYSGDGDLTFEDGRSGGYLTADYGHVQVDGIGGARLDVETGSASVHADRLSTDETVVSTGSGDIDLHFATAPLFADAWAGAGDIVLRVPSGRYDIDAFTHWGLIYFDDISDRPGSVHVLRAETGAGDIIIDGY